MSKYNSEESFVQALDMDALDSVSGGAGSNSNEIEADGTVISLQPNAVFQVDLGGQVIRAAVSGNLRHSYIRILPGDRVRVKYSPGGSARIVYRYK